MEKITEYFEEIETVREYDGYYHSISEAITIVILGSMCGLKNVCQIHQWAASAKVSEFLREEFAIERIPCYYWLLSLLKLIKPESLNKCFVKWIGDIRKEKGECPTISFDGKTVRSTAKMDSYKSPLHIVSAQLSELGFTFAQKSVDGKSNEIPAVQELLRELDIKGCMVVADALNCQRETAKAVVDGKGDYLLSVKDNQPNLKQSIEEFVRDDNLRAEMKTASTLEKGHGRIEKRTAFVTCDIDWLYGKENWRKIACIGAIKKETEYKGEKSCEWHYYISSRALAPEELLHHARMEWSVETMHWLLDVHFGEDFCRVEDVYIQQNLNILRKLVLNLVKAYKQKSAPKRPLSRIMFDCLLDSSFILTVLDKN